MMIMKNKDKGRNTDEEAETERKETRKMVRCGMKEEKEGAGRHKK